MGNQKKKKPNKSKKIKQDFGDKYFDPEKPGSFSGQTTFLKTLPRSDRAEARKWLHKQDSYILHTTPTQKFNRRKTIAPFQTQLQCDLIDLPSLKPHNSNFRYILVAIDVFSKRACVRSLKSKDAKTVADAFQNILDEFGFLPVSVQSDQGREFCNVTFKNLLKSHGVRFFTTTDSGFKASIVERYIKTLMARIYRYLTKQNSLRYIDKLRLINRSYNQTRHSSLGISPSQVSHKNKEQIWLRLYADKNKIKEATHSPPKFNVGDYVRIPSTKKTFTKSYKSAWTGELFKIQKVHQTNPVTYALEDLLGDKILGSFYSQELLKAIYPDFFPIERILDKKKNKLFVKWLHYPPKFNSYVTLGSIKNI